MTVEHKVQLVRKLNDSQKQRLKDHRASVKLTENGKLEFLESQIITPDGKDKINRLVSIKPEPEETIKTSAQVPYLFRDLRHMNLILTNACNLSCSYCYEQHNQDFGRFTSENLLQAYNWFKNVNDQNRKVFQFFGGEPLIHKSLITDFISKHHDYLNSNFDGFNGMIISICSNGILLDDEFIDFYFSKAYTYMLISLDTLNIDLDHREITLEQQQKILQSIDKIIKVVDNPKRLIIRCTLSEETSSTMTEFLSTLYQHGIRNFIVHPLILDSMRGFIKWSDKNWNQLRHDILGFLDQHSDCYMKFSEGVGIKGDNNCMIGSDMIAIDASGDFSGCYFFTNQKANIAGSTILGNIYKDKIYVDRYKKFQLAYAEMFETEEQCKTCDYQQACYQCPAGNIDTGSRMFRPDDMCQKIVKLYLDFQSDLSKKIFFNKVDQLVTACGKYGEESVLSSRIALLAETYFNDKKSLKYYFDNEFPNYKKILGNWLTNKRRNEIDIFDQSHNEIELDDFVKMFNPMDQQGKYFKITDTYSKCFYTQFISVMISNETRINQIKMTSLVS